MASHRIISWRVRCGVCGNCKCLPPPHSSAVDLINAKALMADVISTYNFHIFVPMFAWSVSTEQCVAHCSIFDTDEKRKMCEISRG